MLCGSSSYIDDSGENSNVKAGLRATEPSGVRIIKADYSRFVDGDPSVAMQWRGGAIVVGLTAIPWGWQDRAHPCEFYDEQSAYIHAVRLQRAIAKAGQAERDRREGQRLARMQGREVVR
jgi:hypothetical protein